MPTFAQLLGYLAEDATNLEQSPGSIPRSITPGSITMFIGKHLLAAVSAIFTRYPIFAVGLLFVLIWNFLVSVAIIRNIIGTAIRFYLSTLKATLATLTLLLVYFYFDDIIPAAIPLVTNMLPLIGFVVVVYLYVRLVIWAFKNAFGNGI